MIREAFIYIYIYILKKGGILLSNRKVHKWAKVIIFFLNDLLVEGNTKEILTQKWWTSLYMIRYMV